MTTIISLIGEQNLPNLLPILHIKPARVILVYTDFTAEAARRLTKLIQNKIKADVIPLVVDAYNIEQTESDILAITRPFLPTVVLVNFTGGTKMMSLAAYQAAIELNASIFYLQSQGKQTQLYRYEWDNGRYPAHFVETIPPLITIPDYLDAYLSAYQITGIANSSERGRKFESSVYHLLEAAVDEVCAGVKMLNTVDIDFVIRCGNQIGIIETKTGLNKPKAGIDQLNTAGGQTYLGTYVQKFFVCDQVWGDNLQDLKQIATDRRIQIIELPSFGQSDTISMEDTEKLQAQVRSALGCLSQVADFQWVSSLPN